MQTPPPIDGELTSIVLWGHDDPGKNSLRKYCERKFNINVSRFLRIGNLYSFREIEDEHLKDHEEGVFKFSFESIPQGYFHVPRTVWNEIQRSGYTRTITGIPGPDGVGSPHHLSLANGSSIELQVPNSWIFCVSFETSSVAGAIGRRYEDYWQFDTRMTGWLSEFLANQINLNLKPKHIDPIVFDKLNFWEVRTSFQIRRLVGEVQYQDRTIPIADINSLGSQAIEQASKMANFIKPEKFSEERELRFVFSPFVSGVQIPVSKEPLDIDLKPLLKVMEPIV